MATVAVPHIAMHGHLTAAARIGAVLARDGHRVVSWAPEEYRAQITATGSEFRAHDPIPVRDVMRTPQTLTAALADYTARHAGEIAEEYLELGVDLVLHDFHVLWGRVAGDFLGLPRIVSNSVFPGSDRQLPPFYPLNPAVATPRLTKLIWDAEARVERARLIVAQHWGVDIGHWHGAMVSRAETTLMSTTEEIAGTPAPGPGWHFVGPLTPRPQERAHVRPRPLVVASLGTAFNFSPPRFRTIIEAVADEDYDVVLTTGGGPVRATEMGRLAPNVVVTEFIDDVANRLAGADAFLTHAGTASIHEGMLAGAPMVCVPQGGDQYQWAERVKALGAGIWVEQSAPAIRDGLRRVLADERYRLRARELGERLACFDGEARIAELVQRRLELDGSVAAEL
jgi:MGT family glycosyltransferase